MYKKAFIMGGGTFSFVRNHLALSAPAFGSTGRMLYDIFNKRFVNGNTNISPVLYLTRMAEPQNISAPVTNNDVANLTKRIVADNDTRIIFFNVAMCDFDGQVDDVESGKYGERLLSSNGTRSIKIEPSAKVISGIRKERKDIFLVAFKTTCGATESEQYEAGLRLLKSNSCNLVLANDTKNRRNMIITPEEARYTVTFDRERALEDLVDMTIARSSLSFDRTNVHEEAAVPWEMAPENFRRVMQHCFDSGAYKPFRGITVGHFCVRTSEGMLSSTRKRNHNNVHHEGLVRVVANEDGTLSSFGTGKPSAGARSQHLLLSENPDMDFIVHFHCPLREDHRDDIRVQSQREYECGSLECGLNTVSGIRSFNEGRIKAVMLDNHGPNIMFSKDTPVEEVIEFIDANFNLADKVGGLLND